MNENKGCSDCDHKERGVIHMNKPDTPHFCKLSKDKEFEKWWRDNGDKTSDELGSMPCYKSTEINVLLNQALASCADAMKEIKNEKDRL